MSARKRSRRRVARALLLGVLFGWVGASGLSAAEPPPVGKTAVSMSVPPAPQFFAARPALATLGERLFNDRRLSEPRGTSCATCHDPMQGFAGNNGSRIGVAQGSRPGHFASRNAPSLLYSRYTPKLYFYQDDDSNAPEPRGGLFADGRADSIGAAVVFPLFNPDEMNNRDATQVARKLRAGGYQSAFDEVFGTGTLSDGPRTMNAIGVAIQAYLETDQMAPFTSRYDAFIRGQIALSDTERLGMALFKDPDKGNCASCHVFSPTSNNPTRSLFTDYGYDAIAVPRNRAIPANRDPKHFDNGLCVIGDRLAWPDPQQWCGYFKTPSLRNVAVRERFMHNGVFDSLRQAVAFYATRATDPNKWYGTGIRFDDVPAAARANVNVNSTPYNRREGSSPALDDRDIDAIVAFLVTLTDERYRKPARVAH